MQFEEFVRDGRSDLQRGKAAEASVQLRPRLHAGGSALADVAGEPFAARGGSSPDEERLGAIADRVEADLAQGVRDEIVGELRELTVDYPYASASGSS